MIKTNQIKIGNTIYKITYDREIITSDTLGQISATFEEIRLIDKFCNTELSDSKMYKVLLHEIIHGIDNIVFWNKESDENDEFECAIELFTEYIIDNIDRFVYGDISFEEFAGYCASTELQMKRHQLFFDSILRVIDDNQGLFSEYIELFGKGE